MISVSLKSLLLKFKSITSLFQNELLIITFRAQDFVRTDANYRERPLYSFFFCRTQIPLGNSQFIHLFNKWLFPVCQRVGTLSEELIILNGKLMSDL